MHRTVTLIQQGGVATALGDLCMHPIDTIKTVQQAAPAVRASWSLLHCCGIERDSGDGVVPVVLN